MKVFLPIKLILLVALAATIMQSCGDSFTPSPLPTNDAHQYDSDVYTRWNALFMDIDRYAKGYRPNPGPRTLAYLGFAAYEAVLPGIPENNSLANFYAGLSIPAVESGDHYWPAVVNQSYAVLMERYFFHMKNDQSNLFGRIEQLRKELHSEYAKETTAEILDRSEKRGEAVALAVYQWSAGDQVGHNAFLNAQPVNYTPPVGPGLWKQTLAGDEGRAMFPYWGQARTFALPQSERLARKPIPYSENKQSLFYTQAEEVYNTVNFIKHYDPNNTTQVAQAYEQKWIAEFWSDDMLGVTFAPPTRLVAIANQVVAKERLDLAVSAELFAKIGMALNDCGVAVWYSKYFYNVERPATYIPRVLAQEYPEAANFSTILTNPYTGQANITPAFPAYPSGHSGFGGAGGKILSSFFEFNATHPGTYSFTDNCHFARTEVLGIPRSFRSFRDMAEEDAFSRVPLGVHFRMDCIEGLRLGELAAQRVLELPWKK